MYLNSLGVVQPKKNKQMNTPWTEKIMTNDK